MIAARFSERRANLLRRLRQPEVVIITAIFLLAVALRLAWISYANFDPAGRFGDDFFYDYSAQALADGKGFVGLHGFQTAQWPPGFSVILAVIYKVFGHSILAVKLMNVFVGAGTSVLVYLLGSRVFDKRVGLIGALILALFPGQIFYSALILTESTFPFLLILLILYLLSFISKPESLSPIRLLLLGVFFGALTLIRSEGFVLFAAAVLFWRIVAPSWRRFFLQTSLVAAGMFFAMVPWTIRNYIAMDAFIPFVTGGGHTILAGHQPQPFSTNSRFPEKELQEKYAYLPYPEREIEVEKEAMHKGLEYMFTHPGDEISLIPERVYRFFKRDSDALIWIRGQVDAISLSDEENWSVLADRYYYAVLILALVGIPGWLSIRDKRRLLLVLIASAWTATHVMMVPTARYHAALTPIYSLWAAVPLVFVWDRLSARLRSSRPPATEQIEDETGVK